MKHQKSPGIISCALLSALITVLVAVSCDKKNSGVQNTHSVTPPTDTTSNTAPSKKWVVSTIAGTGQSSLMDGPGQMATFYRPQCIALDQSGNIFVGDQQNFAIRKIDTSYNVTTYSGRSVVNPPIGWGNVYGMVVDNQDNIFMIEYSLVAEITNPTNVLDFAGNLSLNYLDGQG